jgi:hypothetical protein
MFDTLLLQLLSFILNMIDLLLWVLFVALQPMIGVIIPLFILNKIINYFFNISLFGIVKRVRR